MSAPTASGTEEEEERDEEVPLLPLRDAVLLPTTMSAVAVGQPRSERLVAEAVHVSRTIAVVAQRDPESPAAGIEDLHQAATLATIHEVMRSAGITDDLDDAMPVLRVALHGTDRVRIKALRRTDPYFVAVVERAPELREHGLEIEALAGAVRDLFGRMVALDSMLPNELIPAGHAIHDERDLAYFVAATAPLPTSLRQELLEMDSVAAKLRRLVEILQHEIAVREVSRKITAETAADLSKIQRDQILRRQMEAIQRELGEMEPGEADLRELRERLAKLPLPEEVRKEADRELDRLGRMAAMSPEHGMVRGYLDWIAKLPWGKATGEPIDLTHARRVLDEDHYDLDKIKERLLDHLAVVRLREERHVVTGPGVPAEPLLCFVGPPGVGKTSLGQSIARAMGRKLARVSLGGTHDEAEIRGHRRTYVGAMPGRIIQALARAESKNPVFILDEIDKLGVGLHGDPSAALLEVLDPAQNHAFVDHYLGVPFDLSRVIFLCTANTVDRIPLPLLDRMEMIHLAGYTEAEKIFIAERHLLPRQIVANGVRPDEVVVGEDAIRTIVRSYTREAGVRSLEREISGVLRRVVRRIGEGAPTPIAIGAAELPDALGPPRYFAEVAERIDRPGVATGLAFTQAGAGDILFVEATMMPGREERLILTGMLGDVMRESAQAALSYLRTNGATFGVNPALFEGKVVHVHVPVGGIPKDGPSAGVTILAALASLALGRPVRNDLAMTGEITLRGKVLPVGGIKEKVLAAHRAGVRTVLLPSGNAVSLDDVPDEVRRACELVVVDAAPEVLVHALDLGPETPARMAAVLPSVH
jgi:ATP-dependent Lon protease